MTMKNFAVNSGKQMLLSEVSAHYDDEHKVSDRNLDACYRDSLLYLDTEVS